MKLFAGLISIAFLTGAVLVFPSIVKAAEQCTTQYGGQVVCVPTDLTINKLVAKPRQPKEVTSKGGEKSLVYEGPLDFKDNLGIDEAHRAGQEVVFKLIVHNQSNRTFTNIRVVDKFPDFINYVSGPGEFKDRSLVYFIDKLEPGQKHEQEIQAKVFEIKDLTGPENFCLTNRGEVSAEDRAHNDHAQLCVVKAEPAKKLPVAGFEDIFMMIPFIGLGLGGFALIRKNG